MTQVEQDWKQWLLDQKAEGIEVFDLEGSSDVVDEVLVATALNTRHIAHLAEDAMRYGKELKVSLIAADGLEGREWIVLDFGVYMIHLMLPEARVHINMEEHLKSLKRGDFHRDE
jgi:ribosome-associated protein